MMTQEILVKLRRSLLRHEGYDKYPYIDSVGKITIGIGYNLSDRGMSDEWIANQYLEDVNYFYNKLSEFPWFLKLNHDRQIVLIDMCFMGIRKFLSFKKMIVALEKEDYVEAAREIVDSKWASQVGIRANVLADAMWKGVYDI